MRMKSTVLLCVVGVVTLFLLIFGMNCFKTVDAGHVAVASLFGNVVDDVYTEGLQFPVNPLYAWSEYDIREKNLDVPKVPIPTKDQQTSFIDVSVIYRINPTSCPAAKSDVGVG